MGENAGRRDRDDRTSLRDAGLRRIRRVSRWLAGGAVILTGAFAGLAATTRQHQTGAAAGTSPRSAGPAQQQPIRQPSDDGFEHEGGGRAQLQQPAQPPQQAQQAPGGAAPQAFSGASCVVHIAGWPQREPARR